MSNAAFHGNLLKIGMSSKDPSTYRVKELYSTGVPTDFEVEYVAFVDDHKSMERQIHKALNEFRPNKNREFFELSLLEALIIVKGVIAPFLLYDEFSDKALDLIKQRSDIQSYYVNGDVKTKYRYKDGLKHGCCREFYKNGQLRLKQGFALGLRNGIFLEYKKNGEILIRGQYFQDMKQHEWIYYYDDHLESRYYEDDKPVLTSRMIAGDRETPLKTYVQPSEFYEFKRYQGTSHYLETVKKCYG